MAYTYDELFDYLEEVTGEKGWDVKRSPEGDPIVIEGNQFQVVSKRFSTKLEADLFAAHWEKQFPFSRFIDGDGVVASSKGGYRVVLKDADLLRAVISLKLSPAEFNQLEEMWFNQKEVYASLDKKELQDDLEMANRGLERVKKGLREQKENLNLSVFERHYDPMNKKIQKMLIFLIEGQLNPPKPPEPPKKEGPKFK